MAIVTIGGIPVYDAIISDEATGMFKISLVDDPAVMSNFLAFDNNRKVLMYKVEDEEKRLVRGVVMRADFPIYRYDQNFGEYYIIYKADQIRVMAEKYLLESRQNDVNLMHEKNSDVEGVQMVQYFIKGSGISVEGFDEIADGSLFAEFHIVNDEIWDAVKEGTYKGFSLEGAFDLVPEQDKEKVEEIVDTLDGAFSKFLNNTKNFTMGRLNRFKAALLKAFAEFANVTTDKGILAWDGDDDLKVGDQVYIEDAEGNRTPAEDGDYKTDDNKTIVVADGKVSEIKDPEVDVEPTEGEEGEQELASVKTDKGDLLYDGELAVGTEVFVADEEGNQTTAPDGDYTLENGNVVKVAEGKVSEIVEAEPAEETTEQKKEVAASRMQKFAESYNDLMQKMADAIIASGKVPYGETETEWNTGYVVDAGADYCIWNSYGTATEWQDEIYYFPVTLAEDGSVQVGDPLEAKSAFVPKDFSYPWGGESEDTETLKAENESLKKQIAELSAQPLAKPAHDVVTTSQTFEKTGDKGLDRLARIASR